jgi:hypothetical protein
VISTAAFLASPNHACSVAEAAQAERRAEGSSPESAPSGEADDRAGHGTERDPGDASIRNDETLLPAVFTIPVQKVRFLQAMAEDGPGARPCRSGGDPVQRVIQQTLC